MEKFTSILCLFVCLFVKQYIDTNTVYLMMSSNTIYQCKIWKLSLSRGNFQASKIGLGKFQKVSSKFPKWKVSILETSYPYLPTPNMKKPSENRLATSVIRVLRPRLRAWASGCENRFRSRTPTPRSKLAKLELR